MSSDPSLRIKKFISEKTSYLKKKYQPLVKLLNNRSHGRDTNIIKHLRVLESQLGLLMIVGFSLVLNLSIASAKNVEELGNPSTLIGMTPEAIAETTVSISQFLPGISADSEKIKYAMAMQSDINYVTTIEKFNTVMTPEEPSPDPATQKRNQTINYTVAPGDTLSGIAARFGLSVDTIQYTNNISNSDSLNVNQTLKIPSANLSATALAKAKNSTNSKVLAYAGRNTVGRDGGSSSSFIVPVSHHGISQGFSYRHHGIDYMCYVGTPIRAAAAGTVIEADSSGWNYGWGKTVLISHGNGVTSRYAHLSQVNVRVGVRVSQGAIIGKTGNTGNSTGPHLHFQKERNGVPIYPY